jgi:adenine-specific DNA-methyltransferase
MIIENNGDIPERAEQEGLTEYVERLSKSYREIYDATLRKGKGQFFTPKEVSSFMASLFEIRGSAIRLLDPGAGTGILTAAFCERLLDNENVVELMIDTYENDPKLLPFLKSVLESCKEVLEERGCNVKYNIFEQDFILHNEGYFKTDSSMTSKKSTSYDFVISNPPYYKLNKNSPQSVIMKEFIFGQPNIYALFMALSASMVKPEGEMVFITPRSFCSGLYYKKFREWFLSNVKIENIHIFESRKEIFDKDKVLQENIILKGIKLMKSSNTKKLTISTSKNKSFDKLKTFEMEYIDVIHHKNGEVFIRIPTSTTEVDILHIVDNWPNTLRDLNLEISTGPVVPFRATHYLLPKLTKYTKSTPLLWMHNMKDMEVFWPIKKNNKASAIQVCDETMPLLLPVKNYVLLKRFTSKEQRRRLYAAVLLKSKFPYENVGIENHVNYIHKFKGDLSVHEAFGIAAILNTTIIDNYFRALNGNTQVNSTDIRSLPLPKIEDIRTIGKAVYDLKCFSNSSNLDNIFVKSLRINSGIIKK